MRDEKVFVCEDCGWQGKWTKLNPDLSGPLTICPDCDGNIEKVEV